LATADEKEAVFLVQKAFRHNIVVNIAGAFALYLLAAVSLHLLLPEFIESLVPLKFLLLSVIFKSFSTILAAYFTAYKKKPHIPGLINWMILPVHAVLCWFLAQAYGIAGASIATAITFFIHASMFYVFFRAMSKGSSLGQMILPQKGDLAYYLKPFSVLKKGESRAE
jgi:O-antigen/teichoic acid export membrane protein